MSRTFKTEAIVFKRKSLLNKDNVITLFTEKYGKIKAFSYGIKKITSRRLPHNQTANLVKTIVYKKNERFYLQETQLISSFLRIKKEKEKLNFLYFFLFLLDRLLPENQKEEKIYRLTKKFLIELSYKAFNKVRLTDYTNKLLRCLGYIKGERSLSELLIQVEKIINEKLPLSVI